MKQLMSEHSHALNAHAHAHAHAANKFSHIFYMYTAAYFLLGDESGVIAVVCGFALEMRTFQASTAIRSSTPTFGDDAGEGG